MIVHIIDDNDTNLIVMRRLMDRVGGDLSTHCFTDPAKALEASPGQMPDLVIVDFMMPAMDGHEFIRQFKTLPGSKAIPIVMITAATDRAIRHTALDLGVTDFLTKPIDPSEVVSRVRNLIAVRHSFLSLQDRGRWLGDEVRKATRVLTEREANLRLCFSVADAANRESSLERILQFALSELSGYLDCAWSRITVGASDGVPATTVIESADRVAYRSLADLAPIIDGRSGDDTGKPDAIGNETTTAARALGLRGGFVKVVTVEDRPVALLEMVWREDVVLDASHRTLIAQIALQLGCAIERDRTKRRLLYMATHDALTGLANRKLLLEEIDTAVANRDPSEIALLYIDLDAFKSINDTLGHAVGDIVLKQAAERLNAVVSAHVHGAAGRGGLVARVGGDEFVILLTGPLVEDHTVRIADAALDRLQEGISVGAVRLTLTASTGVRCGFALLDSATLLRHADIAMYQAKRSGKARCMAFSSDFEQQTRDKHQLDEELRTAIDRRQFALHYQPILTLADRKVAGFEALIRWHHPSGRMFLPGQFIPRLEETGAIVAIGVWVLREACATLARWARRFPEHPNLTMNINVSARQLEDPSFVEKVRDVLAETRVDARTIRLEITESVTMRELDQAVATMVALRHLGVRICMDDFGTGFSSLSYLHKLPLDIIKIDKSFISSPSDGQHVAQSSIVRSILSLAESMGLGVVAEGIEHESQALELQLLGCTLGQGFSFAKPEAAAEAERWLNAAGAAEADVVAA